MNSNAPLVRQCIEVLIIHDVIPIPMQTHATVDEADTPENARTDLRRASKVTWPRHASRA